MGLIVWRYGGHTLDYNSIVNRRNGNLEHRSLPLKQDYDYHTSNKIKPIPYETYSDEHNSLKGRNLFSSVDSHSMHGVDNKEPSSGWRDDEQDYDYEYYNDEEEEERYLNGQMQNSMPLKYHDLTFDGKHVYREGGEDYSLTDTRSLVSSPRPTYHPPLPVRQPQSGKEL